MNSVLLYLCSGVFTGDPELDYQHPEVGAQHKFLLFLRQSESEPSTVLAQNEAVRFGFRSATVENGKLLSVETLNADSHRGFAGYYEEALLEGSAIAWYPNA
jgi:hypothetical protein